MEWMELRDIDSAEASEEEMALHVKADSADLLVESRGEALPWTMAEELVAGHVATVGAAPTSLSRAWRVLFAAFALLSMTMPVSRAWAVAGSRDSDKVCLV